LERTEAGIALLISIFVLLLISVVAIALIVSSGTETSLAGNYRSSTGVYYAALSGIEEARGRLSGQNPNSFRTTWASFYPTPGSTLPIGTVGYVLNPGPGETAGSLLTTYPDTEYTSEFGAAPSTISTTLSIWNKTPLTTNLSFPGPLYKWVRINAVSELSLKLLDSYPFLDGSQDPTPLYYDGQHLTDTNSAGQVRQVFELTALAVMPNASGQSSQKLVQYLVAPGPITLPPFLAALTLSGSFVTGLDNSPTFHAPNTNKVYSVTGTDSLQGCSGSTVGPVAAIGLFGDYSGGNYNSDLNNGITAGIPTSVGPSPFVNPQLNYTGNTPPHSLPDVEYLSTFPTSLQTPAQVDAIAQNIIQNADAVFVPAGSAATQTAFLTSLGMSATNPLTVIANGNLDISNWSNDGYGFLLVTGTFTYDPDTTWNGLVLVIGQGIVNNSQNGQYKQINGAMFVAKTRNGGTLLTGGIGGASVSFQNGMQGNGVRYSSCWVQKAQPLGGYKVLSFHEIAQ
jgi:hypothetical protein